MLQGRYHVIGLLSAGGFCQTYLAKDTWRTNQPICVIKHLLPASYHPQALPTLKQLFTREAEALQKLNCCDLVPQLLDHFEENFEFYLVQEFIEGRLLSTELQSGFHWSESFVVKLLQEVLEILQVVHSHGLIHGDINPSNLIRRRQDDRLVLIDFGLSEPTWTQVVTTEAKTNITFASSIPATIAFGTPGYMSAEQMRGFPRQNSDIYALGMIAIQALTGLHPRQLLEDSDTGEIIWQHQAKVSDELACILKKMVRYYFKNRYSCATEVLEALQTIANNYKPLQQIKSQHTAYANANQGEAILIEKTGSSTHPTPANQFILLVGVGIGVASVLALTASIYFFVRPPTPASQFQQYQISTP